MMLNGDIESILKFSYDALCDEDKDLFLHIACFFNDENIEKVEEFLAERFKNVRQRLHVLAEKALISIINRFDDTGVKMHNLLVQLGKEVVRKQSVHEPGQRQFLVDEKDICEILTDYTTITRSLIGLDSNYELNINITEEVFQKLPNLQFLRFKYGFDHHPIIISSPDCLNYMSPKLRVLHWSSLSMTCLPFTNNLQFLVELKMDHSELEKLWDGIKLLRNLKWVNLSYSTNLKELPNLSTATSLKELNLRECSSLVELPSSIGNATNLKYLDLRGCSSLVELPFSIGNATNLDRLALSDCSSLVELPSSIGNLHKLETLYMQRCSSLVELPININMESLDELDLSDCWSLKSFPEISTNIEYLNLVGTSIKEVPRSIRSWSRLDELHMSYSENLKEHPYIHHFIIELHLRDTRIQELGPWVRGLSSLGRLVVKGMQNLVSLPQLPHSLRFLDAENCESLEKLDCSFCQPNIHLNFANCFNLNKEARDLIIQTSTLRYAVLPGKEVPACFTYRASGSFVTVKLAQKPLRTSVKFKACFLFDSNSKNEASDRESQEYFSLYWIMITSKEDAHSSHGPLLNPILTEHLYISDFVAEGVTSTDLVIKFGFIRNNCKKTREIKECRIFLKTLICG